MADAPFGLRPGSILIDNDPRTYEDGKPAREVVLTSIGQTRGKWRAFYHGGYRRHSIACNRIFLDDGAPRHSGYNIVQI